MESSVRGSAAAWWWLIATGMLVALAAGPSRGEVVDRVVASIDGEPVTASDLQAYVREHGAGDVPLRDALGAYVTDTLLKKEAEARGIEVGSEDVDRYLARIKAQRGMGDAAFEQALREQGLTVEQYRHEVRAEMEKAELLNREIRSRVSVSPEEVRRHYETHADDYTLAERVRIRMIMIPVGPDASPADVARAETAIRVLQAKIQAGEDFAELAGQYSVGPGASEGGDLGFFEQGQMVNPLEAVAFRLKEGTVSDPIRSSAGYHLLKVEERQGAAALPFEAVADEIREELYQRALGDRYERWLREDLREAHHVEILW